MSDSSIPSSSLASSSFSFSASSRALSPETLSLALSNLTLPNAFANIIGSRGPKGPEGQLLEEEEEDTLRKKAKEIDRGRRTSGI